MMVRFLCGSEHMSYGTGPGSMRGGYSVNCGKALTWLNIEARDESKASGVWQNIENSEDGSKRDIGSTAELSSLDRQSNDCKRDQREEQLD